MKPFPGLRVSTVTTVTLPSSSRGPGPPGQIFVKQVYRHLGDRVQIGHSMQLLPRCSGALEALGARDIGGGTQGFSGAFLKSLAGY
jgi:hypothetical protein